MKLVLQCAMCGTHHPVGTLVCSTCRAEGVTKLRLMFECQRCGALGLSPECEACVPPAAEPTFEVIPAEPREDDLILAEEVVPEAELTLDLTAGKDEAEAAGFDIVDEDESGDEEIVLAEDEDEEGEDDDFDLDDFDSDSDDFDLDLDDDLDDFDLEPEEGESDSDWDDSDLDEVER